MECMESGRESSQARLVEKLVALMKVKIMLTITGSVHCYEYKDFDFCMDHLALMQSYASDYLLRSPLALTFHDNDDNYWSGNASENRHKYHRLSRPSHKYMVE